MNADSESATVDVAMPKLSDSMDEATVLEWLKQPGDEIRHGEPIVEVETDKATIVYEAEVSGVLDEIVVPEGKTAALGATIARVRVAGMSHAASPRIALTEQPEAVRPLSPSTATDVREPKAGSRSRVTPVARKLAQELDVSLEGLEGSGPGGRITSSDIRAAAAEVVRPAGALPPDRRGDAEERVLTPTQRLIARRMSQSRSEIPEFTLETEIDMAPATNLREELRESDRRPHPSLNDFVIRAAALALRDFPGLNASLGDGRVHRHGRVNVGMAVATDDALFVPTIFDADKKSLFELAVETRDLAEKVRRKAVSVDELSHGTFTVSNLGMFGVRRFTAIINYPQAASLAVGEVVARPVVGPSGSLVAGRLMDLTLSCDHRMVYGAEAARFLQRLRNLLEHPAQLDIDRKD